MSRFVLLALLELLVRVAAADGVPPAVTNKTGPQFTVTNKSGVVVGPVTPALAAPCPLSGGRCACRSGECVDARCECQPRSYYELVLRVAGGETLTVELPGTFPDAPPGYVGRFRCFPGDGGPVMQQEGGAAPAAVPFTPATPAPAAVPFSSSSAVLVPTAPTSISVLPAGLFGVTSPCPPGRP